MKKIALALVVVHAAILLGHDYAHRDLEVDLVLWQTLFAYSVIVFAPLVASALTFSARARVGYLVLMLSMLGALVFGVVHHYVLISPDHVDHLPAGETQGVFRSTALWMAVVEGATAIVAVLGFLGASRGSERSS